MENKSASGESSQKPIDYRTANDFIVRYANNVYFEPSLYDLKLTFGIADLSQGQNIVNQHTSLTLPWPQVKVAMHFLAFQLAAYENLHGRIPMQPGIVISPPSEPPMDTSGDFSQEQMTKLWEISQQMFKQFMKDNPDAIPAREKSRK